MKLFNATMQEALRELEDNSVDSIVTDPPYGIDFMGKKWDYDVPSKEMWEECIRVLKPGGHLLSFSSARTYHRMAVSIEDAGFEIRDQVMWCYNSGFPKSHNLGKAYDKKRGIEAEKLIDPDFEMKHIVAEWYEHPDGRHFRLVPDINGTIEVGAQNGRQSARKVYVEQFRKATGINPNSRPNKDNIDTNTHDYGFLGTTDVITVGDNPLEGWGTALKPAHEPIAVCRKPLSEKTVLANAEKWGTGGINVEVSRVGGGRWPANILSDGEVFGDNTKFYFVPKVSKKERNAGLEGKVEPTRKAAGDFRPSYDQDGSSGTAYGRWGEALNTHPTVKPIALMEYLIKLVTPAGGIVLDPFMGSGSTGCAAVKNGYDFIGVEMEEHSYEIAKARIEHWGEK